MIFAPLLLTAFLAGVNCKTADENETVKDLDDRLKNESLSYSLLKDVWDHVAAQYAAEANKRWAAERRYYYGYNRYRRNVPTQLENPPLLDQRNESISIDELNKQNIIDTGDNKEFVNDEIVGEQDLTKSADTGKRNNYNGLVIDNNKHINDPNTFTEYDNEVDNYKKPNVVIKDISGIHGTNGNVFFEPVGEPGIANNGNSYNLNEREDNHPHKADKVSSFTDERAEGSVPTVPEAVMRFSEKGDIQPNNGSSGENKIKDLDEKQKFKNDWSHSMYNTHNSDVDKVVDYSIRESTEESRASTFWNWLRTLFLADLKDVDEPEIDCSDDEGKLKSPFEDDISKEEGGQREHDRTASCQCHVCHCNGSNCNSYESDCCQCMIDLGLNDTLESQFMA